MHTTLGLVMLQKFIFIKFASDINFVTFVAVCGVVLMLFVAVAVVIVVVAILLLTLTLSALCVES